MVGCVFANLTLNNTLVFALMASMGHGALKTIAIQTLVRMEVNAFEPRFQALVPTFNVNAMIPSLVPRAMMHCLIPVCPIRAAMEELVCKATRLLCITADVFHLTLDPIAETFQTSVTLTPTWSFQLPSTCHQRAA